MHEKLVEDWLTKVNELGYQLPFCEVLLAEGYSIIHVSTHGRGEHGKDIVARRHDGVLATFQLKGGDIALGSWRNMRGEVEELVRLPVRLPGVSEDEAHVPHLVTNGEIRGDAGESITRFSDDGVRRGYPKLEVWTRRIVQRKFLDAHGAFLPTELGEFRRFVELYVADFEAPLPKPKFAALIEPLAMRAAGVRPSELRRSIPAICIVGAYVAEQYSRAHNHVAAIEAWVVIAASILSIAERTQAEPEVYRESLTIAYTALRRSLASLAIEALASESFIAARGQLVDPYVYGTRVSIVWGWLAVCAILGRHYGGTVLDPTRTYRLFQREIRAITFAGEVDWPYMLSIALWLDSEWRSAESEWVIQQYARAITLANKGKDTPGFPPPYWSHEKVLKLANGMLPPYEQEKFSGRSYTLMSALDALVRRLRRQAVSALWPAASKIDYCDFRPDERPDFFCWRASKGALRSGSHVREASWTTWRERVCRISANSVPVTLVRHPEWVLPFLLTYPHRANREMSALAEWSCRRGLLIE